jgi:hypothetical protein
LQGSSRLQIAAPATASAPEMISVRRRSRPPVTWTDRLRRSKQEAWLIAWPRRHPGGIGVVGPSTICRAIRRAPAGHAASTSNGATDLAAVALAASIGACRSPRWRSSRRAAAAGRTAGRRADKTPSGPPRRTTGTSCVPQGRASDRHRLARRGRRYAASSTID